MFFDTRKSDDNPDIIDTEDELFIYIAEWGRMFAEGELLKDKDLYLCMRWIEINTALWRGRFPEILENLGIGYDDEDVKKTVTHFMTAAVIRLDELTGHGRRVQPGTA